MDKRAGAPHLPGFGLREFYAAKRIYRGLELFGSVDNFTDSRDPNLGAQLPIFRTELVECASRGRRSAAKARENWKIQWIRRLSKTANKGGAEAPA
jgi:hypothetical protein